MVLALTIISSISPNRILTSIIILIFKANFYEDKVNVQTLLFKFFRNLL